MLCLAAEIVFWYQGFQGEGSVSFEIFDLVSHHDPPPKLSRRMRGSGSHCVGDTSQVNSYPNGASPYGVLDLAGNVWEWTNDWYDDNYYSVSPYSNPLGPVSGSSRAVRGGDYSQMTGNLRVSVRTGTNPNLDFGYKGFRCAADAP